MRACATGGPLLSNEPLSIHFSMAPYILLSARFPTRRFPIHFSIAPYILLWLLGRWGPAGFFIPQLSGCVCACVRVYVRRVCGKRERVCARGAHRRHFSLSNKARRRDKRAHTHSPSIERSSYPSLFFSPHCLSTFGESKMCGGGACAIPTARTLPSAVRANRTRAQ